MKAEIIAVGTELLLGDIVNTNAQYLAKELAQMGFDVNFQSVVGDNRERLKKTITQAVTRSNIVITTGGLGPTEDDLTKETACELLRMPLETNEEELVKLKARMKDRVGCEISSNNLKQAMFPRGGIILANPNGTAPGLAIESPNKKQIICLLPGPPFEMKPMFENEVVPLLKQKVEGIIKSRRLEIYGIGESKLDVILKEEMENENPTVAPYANIGQCSVRISAKTKDEATADKLIDEMEARIAEKIGDNIYGYNGEALEDVVVRELKSSGLKIATAESCTGGLIANRLTNINGATGIMAGGFCTYSVKSKIDVLGLDPHIIENNGVISAQVAAQMAIAAARITGADVAVSTTGNTNVGDTLHPTGEIYIGLHAFGKTYVKKVDVSYGTTRDRMKHMAASQALDFARRSIDPDKKATIEKYIFDKNYNENIDLEIESQFLGKEKEDKPKKQTTGVGLLIFALLLSLFIGGYILMEFLDFGDTEIAEIPQSSDSTGDVVLTDYQQLVANYNDVNTDTAGVITIADTTFPYLQSTDNEYYKNVNFEGEEASLGAVYMDYRLSVSETNTNKVIYGNSDGDLSVIKNYTDVNYLIENAYINVGTITADKEYVIVSVYYANIDGEFEFWNYFGNTDETITAAFVDEIYARSIYNVDVNFNNTDSYVTLYIESDTNDGEYLVVTARALRDGESSDDEYIATVATYVLSPDELGDYSKIMQAY